MKPFLILLSLLALGCAKPEPTTPIESRPIITQGGGMVLEYEKNGVGESVPNVSEVQVRPSASAGPGAPPTMDVFYVSEGVDYVVRGVTSAKATQ